MNTPCIEWTRAKTKNGYGVKSINRKVKYVHRLAYEFEHNVELTSEQFVCHRCDNPSCYNPDHLFLGTARDNNLDALHKGRKPTGDKASFSVLSNDQVAEIREKASKGVRNKDLARQYNVHQSHISKIVGGTARRHG